jgi:glycosyltransferase involved in cell wall biosynthesis
VATVFYAYRDSPQRRRALAAPLGDPERYLLFGLDQLAERGWTVRHDLERAGPPPRWARAGGRVLQAGLERAGGYGGDFATVLASLRQANCADVVLSTVDTVGIPLMLLNHAGRLRRPLVYVAVGLPERLARLGSGRMRRLYARALAGTAAVVAYSEAEVDDLHSFMAEHGVTTRVEFVPFGVDEKAFRPSVGQPSVDVVMAGADPHRDVDLFMGLAAELPNRSFRLVTTAERARTLGAPPPNLEVEADIPFDRMKRRLEDARVVALPVLDNSYSGATTVLLQAMALGKPVVVTRTRAIASGYGLVDGENCRLVDPGDRDALARTVAAVLRDEWHARSLGARARSLVETQRSWAAYVDRLETALRSALGPGGRVGTMP